MAIVLHIITRLDMGGSAQNTLSTCRGPLEHNYQVILATGLSQESQMTAIEKGIVARNVKAAVKKGLSLKILPTLVRKIDPIRDMIALLSIWRLIRKVKPHIVHTHSSKAGILGRLAAWLARVPLIIHTPHGHVFYGHFPPGQSKLYLSLEAAFDNITDRTIALTSGECEDYVRLSVSSRKKLVKIHSGVSLEKFKNPGGNPKEIKAAIGLGADDLVVGTIGWLLPIKGPVYLLEALQLLWPQHPNTNLIYIGKGELESRLKELAAETGIYEKVRFLGWRDDVHRILPIIDIFVLPSLNEGMGRAVVEAMAAGKPVVASRTGGIPDLVVNGTTGYLTEPGDPDGLANAIGRLLDNPVLRRQMGQEGRKRCTLFSEKLMIAKVAELYKELLK